MELSKCHKPSTEVSRSTSRCNLCRWESKGSELENSFRRSQQFEVHFFAIRVFFRIFSFHFKIHEVMANMSTSAHDNIYVE